MLEAIAALVIATTALLGSPGPATLSLAAVGATTGVIRGLPYYFGILSGLLFVIVGAVGGLAALLTRWPQAGIVIQVLGVAYLLFIAWKIGSASTVSDDSGDQQVHPGFRDGFVLNILNPKAYAAFLALFGQFLLPAGRPLAAYLATTLVCFVIAIIVDAAWLLGGGLLQSTFRDPRSARIVRIVFAGLLVAVTIWMVANGWSQHVG